MRSEGSTHKGAQILISTLRLPLCQLSTESFKVDSCVLEYKHNFVDFTCCISPDETTLVIVTGYIRLDHSTDGIEEKNKYIDKCQIALTGADFTSSSCQDVDISLQQRTFLYHASDPTHGKLVDFAVSPQNDKIVLLTQQYEIFLFSLSHQRHGPILKLPRDFRPLTKTGIPCLWCRYAQTNGQSLILVASSNASIHLLSEDRQCDDEFPLRLIKSVDKNFFAAKLEIDYKYHMELSNFQLCSLDNRIAFFVIRAWSGTFIMRFDVLSGAILNKVKVNSSSDFGVRCNFRNVAHFMSFDGREMLVVNKDAKELTYSEAFPMKMSLVNIALCATLKAFTRTQLRALVFPKAIHILLGL